ncbi:hypothetical protein DYB37_011411 [Aphanomyces astaci]|uniref:Uncharacterized protein n=1 Tax=Aphanomyces astaci TaxID=112090 RepID=A0A397B9Q7_APHAT|nr:hypothetical protein DYB36_004210 [Aphanomyces astaci]RHY15534.1 hypothetical protein DYB25_003207 [Aphanomyces astaci]RHY74412.1 hypothetical protein DYB34_013686 [Aphanomyces astaci]RHY86350.1 hypothetical protein DYB31_001567 [Aphanomyces astaci]RHY99410.1 hypothetical protein DYB35_011490 [Aphanomyces astaci]
MAQIKTCHFKLVLIGDTAVGKSCLVVRFVRDEFFEFQEPTIGAAFLTQTVSMDDGVTVKFEIWDTAGQARQYANDNGILHMETSAKTAANVKDLFVAIAEKLPKNPTQPEREAFPITAPPSQKPARGGCC